MLHETELIFLKRRCFSKLKEVLKVDEIVHQQDGETCIMRWREVLHKFEKMERCAP